MTTQPLPRLKIELSVMGDFDPDAFTERVGLEPSQTWRRGERSEQEPRFAGRTVPVCDHWAFGLPERHEPYLEPLVDELLEKAGERLTALHQAVTDLGLSLELSVVAKCEEATTSSPSIHLSASQMSVLGRIGAILDVDLYVYE